MTQGSSKIAAVLARQILDSRGRPTVEADVVLEDGTVGRACAPSGASMGRHEARELRDRDPSIYGGLGVLQAVQNVTGEVAEHLKGHDALDQLGIDSGLTALDGSGIFERLGANGILATSMAVARAAAAHQGIALYRYISTLDDCEPMSMPMPMTNILSGGAHAGRGMDLQDYLTVPVGARTYSEALEMIARVRASASDVMHERGLSVLLADEGGLSPGFSKATDALDLMMLAIERAGMRPGLDMAIALDVAASELFSQDEYVLPRQGARFDGSGMAQFLADLIRLYPIVSIEDPLDQDDWDNWQSFTRIAQDVQIVGDDLFVTNGDRIARGVELKVANAALIKLNQNGTLSGTLAAMRVASEAGYATVVSARSGETEDTFIADLAVGTGAGQIKIGSVRNSERLAKYNQLLRIEGETDLPFAGVSKLAGSRWLKAA